MAGSGGRSDLSVGIVGARATRTARPLWSRLIRLRRQGHGFVRTDCGREDIERDALVGLALVALFTSPAVAARLAVLTLRAILAFVTVVAIARPLRAALGTLGDLGF